MTTDRPSSQRPQRPRRSSYRFSHPEEKTTGRRRTSASMREDIPVRGARNRHAAAYDSYEQEPYAANKRYRRAHENGVTYDDDYDDDDLYGDDNYDGNDYDGGGYDDGDSYDSDSYDDEYEAGGFYDKSNDTGSRRYGTRSYAAHNSARREGPHAPQQETSHGTSSRRKKRKPIVRILLVLVLLFAIAAVGSTLSKGIHWTVAVFGVDSRDGDLEKGTRSDVIMIADINQLTGSVKLCSVFRDTYLRIDRDGNYNKINAAYERGGHKQAVQALEDNLDIKIDDYVTFNWAAVAAGINALGGVDLEISDAEFSYINGFITETVNSTGIGSTQLTHAGMNHLDGVQAVAYGRLRLMDTDFNRTARQRKVLSLALDKAKQASAGTLMNIAKGLLPQVSTSVGITDLIPVINTLGRYHIPDDASSGFPFSRQTMNIGKLDSVVPTTLASNVTTLHEFLYGKKNFKPSSTVEEISQHIAEKTGLTQAGENAPEAGTGGGIVRREKATAAPQQTEAVTAPAETESSTAESTSETEEIPDEPIETDDFGEILPGEDGEIHDGERPDTPEEPGEGQEPGSDSTGNGNHSTTHAKPTETKPAETKPSETRPAEPEAPAARPTTPATEPAGPGTGDNSGSVVVGPGAEEPGASGPGSDL